MIEVKVENILLSNKGFVVLLKSSLDERTLPIFIGDKEAQAIAIQLGNVEIQRPLTHDLFRIVLETLGCRVVKVVVNDLIDNTFYALIYLEHDGKSYEIDSRPSDAIAIALRFSAPVYVNEKVMDEAGIILKEEIIDQTKQPKKSVNDSDASHEIKENLTPLQILQHKLNEAIKKELYEEAARIRDEIRKLTDQN